ncbi:hypothetical protein CEXT_380051 [Caerostris extrusa]|uniref:Uncharacterized protein n=1 Tax=Caerostris extrusa TaxID=172846 RepID=A0AAV4T8L0_CAEEX|nr:hypothetical protein CEXT_380051 [Caerostris extrusa]
MGSNGEYIFSCYDYFGGSLKEISFVASKGKNIPKFLSFVCWNEKRGDRYSEKDMWVISSIWNFKRKMRNSGKHLLLYNDSLVSPAYDIRGRKSS